MRRIILLFVLATMFLALTTWIYAEVPHLIRFQGKVTDKDGVPLNGSYNITFRIYDAETGGTLKWSETQSSVPVNSGIFTVLLGNATSLDLPFDEPYWLSMEVGSDGEMSPRQAISSVGYAIHAEVADSIAGVSVVPKGAIIMIKDPYPTSDGCPVGYKRVGELDNKFLVGGSSYNSAAGGSTTHTHPAGSYQVSAHTHSISDVTRCVGWNAQAGVGDGISASGAALAGDVNNLIVQSGGGSSVSGSSGTTDSRPPFATVIMCEKE